MTDTATLQARLAEAEAALHALNIGSQRVSISFDGKSLTYTPADATRLRAYIGELKAQLGQGSRPRPLTMVFK
ncbi:gpW family head-tail joining protein [Ferrovibrio xuzhouensis]|uniref:GpW family head-tail joining protein n=1 Tax=Ferrovibrio xuzhouensis TaxID=1576914 RepID=A0ABV7VB99_9PROT